MKFTSVDEYIASYPPEVQSKLEELRATIKASDPNVEEKISYDMPGFTLNGSLLYFAVWKKHIGLYGAAGAVDAFADETSAYAGEKGALKFPLDKPLPLNLVRRIVEYRVAENLNKTKKSY